MFLLSMLPYLLITVFHLICCLRRSGAARKAQNLSKVFLMPLLLLFYLLNARPAPEGLVVSAILCGWLGDVLLLFPDKTPRTVSGLVTFLTGLASFLIGHILYALALFGRVGQPAPLPAVPLAVLLLAAGAAAYATLHRHLAELRIPIIAYLIVILTMAFFALMLPFGPAGAEPSALLAAAGAVSFVVSDYLLARSLFLANEKGRLRDFLIMFFYLSAQLGITVSFLIA